MRSSVVFLALTAFYLQSNVFGRPIDFVAPHEDPEPGIGIHGPDEGPVTVPGGGGSSQEPKIGVSSYNPPASFGAFPGKGQQLVDSLAKASGPDNDQGYADKINSYSVIDEDNAVKPFDGDGGDVGNNLKVPFEAIEIENDAQWRLREIYGKDLTQDPSSVVYHSRGQHALIVTDTFNDKLGADFPQQNLLFHSELTFQGWKAAPQASAGDISKLKYVVVAQIQNTDTPQIINDARASVAGSQTAGTEVTFMAVSQNDAEQQGFYALAGTENGKFVFRMLTDHHNELGDLKVVAVHTWAGVSGTSDPTLVWELA